MAKKAENIEEEKPRKAASKKLDEPTDNRGSASYSAKDIQVLEGLEPVRKRPGMYIGSTGEQGLHHLIWEVFDNSLDEAMAGYAKSITVELLKDGTVTVADDGRGIPVDIHPKTKKSALETAATTLHAGGKFDGDSYKVSGGLHGVGLSVVNALSTWMKIEVCKEGTMYAQEYKIGKPQYDVKKVGKCTANGTKVSFRPDGSIFSVLEFDRKEIVSHLRRQAFLTKGIRIEIIDDREDLPFYYSFYFEGGLISFVRYANRNHNPVHKETFYAHKSYEGIEVESAFIYNDDPDARELSFANNVYTPDGGMHVTGFRTALTRALNEFARSINALKGTEENLTGDDVREGITAIISVKLRDPQFEGQTKARLGTPAARGAVESVLSEALKEYFEKYSGDGKAIIEKCILAQKARKAAKAAKDTVLRKGMLEGMTLPGKLADCSSRKAADSELYIVEGDSAGGCFFGKTEVALIDGRNISFEELVEEDKQGKQNYCYTIKDDGHIGIAPILHPRITKTNASVVKVILDTDTELICTPGHLFRLVDGSYIPAVELTSDHSIAPLYRELSKREGRSTLEGYEMVFDPMSKRWIYTHVLADMYNLRNEVYGASAGKYRHHKDFNKLNNNPENIQRLPREQHMQVHCDHLEHTLHRPDIKIKSTEAKRTKEFRELARNKSLEKSGLFRANAKKQWESEAYKAFMTAKFLEFYYSNDGYRKKNNERLNAVQREYWSNEENRSKQAERVKNHFESHPERKVLLSEMAKAQWQDSVLLDWRKSKTSEQWTTDFRQKRKESYGKMYLEKALRTLHGIYKTKHTVDKDSYNAIRKETNDKSLIKYETICQRFFSGDERKLEDAVMHYNHRIKAVVPMEETFDVYDIEVPETHNFALAAGIFVHNSAKQGRDRRFQAILPLKGKILNVERARLDKMLVNNEIKSLVIALGTAISDSFDIEKLRYHKVVIMTDADTDGAHIRTLLLTLFYRFFRPVIDGGFLYIAQPPLFRLQLGKDVRYVYTPEQKDKAVAEMTAGKKAESNVNVQRYKGLGEMNPDQLWETTMNPEFRTLLQVEIDDAEEADRLFEILMGDEVAPRKQFIQSNATLVKNLDIT